MSFPTTPAFVVHGDFSPATQQHPGMKFLEAMKLDFDARRWTADYYAADFTWVAPNGQAYEGRDKALDALKAQYAPLTAHWHEPFYQICTPTDYGYEMIGSATMWANLPGEPAAGETKKVDRNGTAWDVAGPGGFRFHIVKSGDSFQLSRMEVTADSGPVLMTMVKRGLLAAKDLGL